MRLLDEVDEIDKQDKFRFKISNKYYDALITVQVYPHLNFSLSANDEEIFTSMKAFVFLCNAKEPINLSAIKSWISYLKDRNLEAKICAVYDVEAGSESDLDDLFNLCVENNIEYVNANGDEEEEDKSLDIFLSSRLPRKWVVGVERIAEALSFVQWSDANFRRNFFPHKYYNDDNPPRPTEFETAHSATTQLDRFDSE